MSTHDLQKTANELHAGMQRALDSLGDRGLPSPSSTPQEPEDIPPVEKIIAESKDIDMQTIALEARLDRYIAENPNLRPHTGYHHPQPYLRYRRQHRGRRRKAAAAAAAAHSSHRLVTCPNGHVQFIPAELAEMVEMNNQLKARRQWVLENYRRFVEAKVAGAAAIKTMVGLLESLGSMPGRIPGMEMSYEDVKARNELRGEWAKVMAEVRERAVDRGQIVGVL